MGVRESILPALDVIRSIAGLPAFNLRPYTVKIRVRTWTGERPGAGTFSDVDTVMLNAGAPVRVKRLAQKDVIASGGLYSDRDFLVGPMTPVYGSSGYNGDALDPVVPAQPVEVFWNMTGPDIADAGAWFKKIGEDASSLHYFVRLRQTAEQP